MPVFLVFLALFVLSSTLPLAAQGPTLTAADLNPTLNTSYDAYLITDTTISFSPGGKGPNQSWDFSAFSSGTRRTYGYVSPAGQPGSTGFRGANLCIVAYSLSGNPPGYSYAYTDNAGFSTLGSYTATAVSGNTYHTTITYSPTLDQLRYPISLNTTFQYPINCVIASDAPHALTYYRYGTAKITADAYGTLTTVTGTYHNVLRLHYTDSYKDSASFSGTSVITNYKTDSYYWYINGVPYPLFFHSDVYNGTAHLKTATWTIPTHTPVAEVLPSYPLAAVLAPNPVPAGLHEAILNYHLNTPATLSLDILDGAGRLLHSFSLGRQSAGSQQFTFPTDGLAPGVYLLRLYGPEAGAAMQKLVVTE